MGRGLIHDDFQLLNSSAFKSLSEGLSTATGPFFTPLAWLSFRLDWMFWGLEPFASSLVNLAFHLVNIALVYFLSRYLWSNETAALISALGFSLLLPSSVWAVMWVGTRAHLITTAFYLAAVFAAFWWIRSGRSVAAFVTIVAACAAIFSKESGITVVGSLVIVFVFGWHERSIPSWRTAIVILLSVSAAAAVYLVMRANSGAVGITFGSSEWYSFQPSFSIFVDNIRAYAWRTIGWLSLYWVAVVVGVLIARRRIAWSNIQITVLALPLSLAVLAILPVLLIGGRSGIYTYLPGAFSATLLSMFLAKQFRKDDLHQIAVVASVAVVGIGFSIFIVGQSEKWRTMAETSSAVLTQIRAQVPKPEVNSAFVIEYDEADPRFYFPDCFASWGLESAVRLVYRDPTLRGAVRTGVTHPAAGGHHEIRFVYSSKSGSPSVVLK